MYGATESISGSACGFAGSLTVEVLGFRESASGVSEVVMRFNDEKTPGGRAAGRFRSSDCVMTEAIESLLSVRST